MEVRVRERLVGALVLVAIVVLFVPAILKGRGPAPAERPVQPTHRVEVPANNALPEPEEQILVPEPDSSPPLPESRASAEDASAPQPASAKDVIPAPPVPAKESAPVIRADDKPTPAAQKPPATGNTTAPAWAVQLGAFSSRAKAEQLVAELRKRRYSAFILEYRATGQVLYRVRVGPEQDRARAEEIAARLAKDGFQPVVARHP